MSFLHSLLSLPREGLVTLGIVVISLLAAWALTLFSRRRYVTIKQSEETEVIIFHLRRIADAVERLAVARETRTSVNTGGRPAGVSMSAR